MYSFVYTDDQGNTYTILQLLKKVLKETSEAGTKLYKHTLELSVGDYNLIYITTSSSKITQSLYPGIVNPLIVQLQRKSSPLIIPVCGYRTSFTTLIFNYVNSLDAIDHIDINTVDLEFEDTVELL